MLDVVLSNVLAAPNAATRPEIEHVVEPVADSADYKFYEPGQAPEYVADYGKNISERCQVCFFREKSTSASGLPIFTISGSGTFSTYYE